MCKALCCQTLCILEQQSEADTAPLILPLCAGRRRFRRIIESQNALGWEGPLKAIQPNPPAMSRDIFSWTRLLRAPSNLAWNVPSDGPSTTSLGNLCQGFTTLSVKNFFFLVLAAPWASEPAGGGRQPCAELTRVIISLETHWYRYYFSSYTIAKNV